MTDIAKKEELAQARATASQIRQGIHNYLATLALIAKAYERDHWRVLGYKDWQSYVDGEFGADRLRLPDEHRQKAIAELRLSGMSVRAISTATGVPRSTVADTIAEVSDAGHLPAETKTKGTDGKAYAGSRPSTPSGDRKADAQPAPDATSESEAPPRAGEAAAETSGASVSADASGDSVGADAAGDPTGYEPAGSPVNPLDDPKQVERQHREQSSRSVAEGLVNIYSALDPNPIRWLTKWVPNAYRQRGVAYVEDILTPAGLRTIAQHLDTLADYLEKTDGAL